MLKVFTADNFKSLVNITFRPAGLNLVIGANNAGKTNLCQAMRFLSLSSRMPLDDAAAFCTGEAWNILNVYIERDTFMLGATCQLGVGEETLTFEYELTISSPRTVRPSFLMLARFSVESETLKVSGGRFADTTLLENKRGRVRLLHEGRFLRGATGAGESLYVETKAPTDTTMVFRLYDLETNRRANAFKRYLSSWGYYSLNPGSLRQTQARAGESVLEASGRNLSSVLFSLHTSKPRTEKKLIAAVKIVEPRLDLFSFQAPDPEHIYMFFEDVKGNRFGLDSVSDGTLRYLAISYLLLPPEDRGPEDLSAPVIMLEEPENGIFVEYLKPLFERIEPSGKSGQLVFTSHSPYFIDLFDAALDGLFVVKAGETHSLLVKPDEVRIREMLGQFSIGEMHFRGLLS